MVSSNRSSEALRARLEETIVRDQDLEREILAGWSAVDYESWQRIDEPESAPGREIKKTRPVVVIQNNVGNRLSRLTIVAPITSTIRFPVNPLQVLIAGNPKTGITVTSVAVLSQIRAVDRTTLLKHLDEIDSETMESIDEAIKISLGLVKF